MHAHYFHGQCIIIDLSIRLLNPVSTSLALPVLAPIHPVRPGVRGDCALSQPSHTHSHSQGHSQRHSCVISAVSLPKQLGSLRTSSPIPPRPLHRSQTSTACGHLQVTEEYFHLATLTECASPLFSPSTLNPIVLSYSDTSLALNSPSNTENVTKISPYQQAAGIDNESQRCRQEYNSSPATV